MTVKEIKKTVEQVVSTEYIAEDGEVFRSEEECKQYEESALFAVSKQLKRLSKNQTTHCDLNYDLCSDQALEIFDVQTEKDLENLKRYLYLTLSKQGMSEKVINSYFTSDNGCRNDHVFDNVTVGHEVMIFWNYEGDCFWVYKDGSLNGYFEWLRERYNKIVTPEEPETKSE